MIDRRRRALAAVAIAIAVLSLGAAGGYYTAALFTASEDVDGSFETAETFGTEEIVVSVQEGDEDAEADAESSDDEYEEDETENET